MKQVRVAQTNLRCLNVLTEDALINYFQLTKGNLFYRLQDQTSLKITGVFPGEEITLKVKDSGYNSLNKLFELILLYSGSVDCSRLVLLVLSYN